MRYNKNRQSAGPMGRPNYKEEFIVKKIVRVLACALATACVLSACGGSQSTAGNAQSTAGSQGGASGDNGEKITLTYWGYSRHNLDFVQARIDAFNEQNPDIEVVYEVMSDNYDNNLELAFQGNQAPDIFSVKGGSVVSYVKKGMAKSLDEYLTDEIKANHGDTLYLENINSYKGEVYSLTQTGNPFRLIYNKDIFERAGLDPEAPPTTLEEVRAAAKTITEKLSGEGVYGFAMNMKSAYSALFRSVDECAARSGLYPYNYDTGRYEFDGYAQVAKVFRDMYADGSFFPGAEGLDIDPLRAQFALGNIGMYMSGYWEVGVYDGQFPTDQNWAAAPMPTLTGEVLGKTDLNGAGVSDMISSSCEHPEAAWKFLEFMNDVDYLAEYQKEGYGLVVVPAVAEIAEPSDTYGSEYFTVRDDEYVRPAPPHRAGMALDGQTYWDVFNAYIMGEGPEDATAIVEELETRYNAALDAALEAGEFDPIVNS